MIGGPHAGLGKVGIMTTGDGCRVAYRVDDAAIGRGAIGSETLEALSLAGDMSVYGRRDKVLIVREEDASLAVGDFLRWVNENRVTALDLPTA